jgi:hypothetical protein
LYTHSRLVLLKKCGNHDLDNHQVPCDILSLFYAVFMLVGIAILNFSRKLLNDPSSTKGIYSRASIV